MNISILTPTRVRPSSIDRLVMSCLKTATDATKIEFVFYIDNDDNASKEKLEELKVKISPDQIKYLQGPRIVLSEMWNQIQPLATADIFMHCGDDIVFQTNYNQRKAALTYTQANAAEVKTSVAYEFREELQNDRFHIVLSVSPATTGTNAMRIELLNPKRVNNFTIKLIPPDPAFEGIQINVPLKRRGAAIVAYDGLFNLKVAGVWSIEVTGATTTGEMVPLATTLNVVQSTTPETTIAPETTLPTETTVGG